MLSRLPSPLGLLVVALLQLGWARHASALFFGLIGEQRFKYEGLIDVGPLGLDNVDGIVAALADVDGEQALELVMLSADQRSLSLYSWNRAKYAFQPVGGKKAQPFLHAPFVVTNLVPGDYDYDGRLDLLLMGEENPGGWWGDNELKLQMHRGQGGGRFAEATSVPSSGLAQPMAFDAQGDMKVDLLGFPSGDAKQQNLKIWKNDWLASNKSHLFTLSDPPLDMASFNCQFPNPHSNAFIDLDGDCLADLFLVCEDPSDAQRLSYQIWVNAKEAGFKLAQSGPLPRGTAPGAITFADMDRDGTMDMVFPTCEGGSAGCAINIAYNTQMPLCQQTASGFAGVNLQTVLQSKRRCREATDLCVADDQFKFDLTQSESNSAFQRIPMSTLFPSAPHIILSDPSFRGALPNPLRIGDFNKDGHPDLLVVSASHSSAQSGSVSLLQSIPCDKKTCSRAETEASRRTFSRMDGESASALDRISDARSALWLDIDEDGSLDILVQRNGKGSGASRTFTFIKNNYYHDAFFLKTLFGNGACEGVCQDENGTRYKPYGVSYSGASYKFTVLDPTGARKATSVGQLPQTGYLSSQAPHSYIGLGRTNNYVENLFVGSTRHQDAHYLSIEGLIPNSQLVVVPYQPEDGEDPSTWNKQLFLQPGWWIFWVGVALVTAFVVLAVVVLVLSLNEKRQDELERRHAMHLINFDAL